MSPVVIRLALAAGTVAALALATTAVAQQPAGTGEEHGACAYSFTSGNGMTELTWCVSAHGNIGWLETPNGAEHLAAGSLIEGYVVCSDHTGAGVLTVNGYDSGGFGESAWGPVAASNLSAGGVTITRTTADGRITLIMKFSRNSAERFVSVAMTVRNSGSSKLYKVKLARYADIDANGSFTNAFVKTYNTIVGVHETSEFGLALTTNNVNNFHSTAIVDLFSSTNYATCSFEPQPNPAIGDYGGKILSHLKDLAPGQSQTITFRYRQP